MEDAGEVLLGVLPHLQQVLQDGGREGGGGGGERGGCSLHRWRRRSGRGLLEEEQLGELVEPLLGQSLLSLEKGAQRVVRRGFHFGSVKQVASEKNNRKTNTSIEEW